MTERQVSALQLRNCIFVLPRFKFEDRSVFLIVCDQEGADWLSRNLLQLRAGDGDEIVLGDGDPFFSSAGTMTIRPSTNTALGRLAQSPYLVELAKDDIHEFHELADSVRRSKAGGHNSFYAGDHEKIRVILSKEEYSEAARLDFLESQSGHYVA